MLYFRLLRFKHYLKNFYIFMPAFFGGRILEESIALNSLIAFVLFSLTASSIYIFNDIQDVEEDRRHPEKRKRPIAAGEISIGQATLVGIALAIIALGGAFWFEPNLAYVLLIYFLLNLAYSWRLKQIAILDIAIVSLGFILRIEAGHVVTGIELSQWLVMMVFLLSMFQAMAKRLDDLVLLKEQATESRKSINGYNNEFLRIGLSIFSAVLLVCYILYISSPENVERLGNSSYYTTLPVILGVLRYLQVIYVFKHSYDPVKILLKDRFLQLVFLFWIASFVALLYV